MMGRQPHSGNFSRLPLKASFALGGRGVRLFSVRAAFGIAPAGLMHW